MATSLALAALLGAGCASANVGQGSLDGSVSVSTQGVSPILHTDGRRLLDRCNNPLVIRGVENFLGNQLPQGNDWSGFLDHIAETGANAVRIIPTISVLSTADIDSVLTHIESHDMVAFISPTDRTWFGRDDVKTMLAAHEGILILDAFQEPNYDDRTRWFTDATAAIDQVRGYGYRVPITVLANQYGRDLPVLLQRGAEVVAHDPQHNTILGWQAYWGSGGWYQSHYGMTVEQGIANAASQTFPIQLGLDEVTDANQTMDYGAAMTAAQQYGVGWLWWDWYNPYGTSNSLTTDGTMAGLNARGTTIVQTHPAGIQHTSVKTCRPAQ